MHRRLALKREINGGIARRRGAAQSIYFLFINVTLSEQPSVLDI